jgi:phospholipid-binding lipoprotein MlaA
LPLDETLAGVYDKYGFVRNAYLQRRQFLVYDGNPPEEPLEEEVLDDTGSDDEGAPPPQP